MSPKRHPPLTVERPNDTLWAQNETSEANEAYETTSKRAASYVEAAHVGDCIRCQHPQSLSLLVGVCRCPRDIDLEQKRKLLMDDRKNIELAALLLNKYLSKFNCDMRNGFVAESFISAIMHDKYAEDKFKNYSDDDRYRMARLAIFAAIWNNGYNVIKVVDVKNQSPNAYAHSLNIRELIKYT